MPNTAPPTTAALPAPPSQSHSALGCARFSRRLVQVLAKSSGSHFRAQVAVRRGYPRTSVLASLRPPTRRYSPLAGSAAASAANQRQLSDLVQERRAAVGVLARAAACGVRGREAPRSCPNRSLSIRLAATTLQSKTPEGPLTPRARATAGSGSAGADARGRAPRAATRHAAPEAGAEARSALRRKPRLRPIMTSHQRARTAPLANPRCC